MDQVLSTLHIPAETKEEDETEKPKLPKLFNSKDE